MQRNSYFNKINMFSASKFFTPILTLVFIFDNYRYFPDSRKISCQKKIELSFYYKYSSQNTSIQRTNIYLDSDVFWRRSDVFMRSSIFFCHTRIIFSHVPNMTPLDTENRIFFIGREKCSNISLIFVICGICLMRKHTSLAYSSHSLNKAVLGANSPLTRQVLYLQNGLGGELSLEKSLLRPIPRHDECCSTDRAMCTGAAIPWPLSLG